ncbi:hypothetical protein CMK20_18930 [Candidatus Poribacteria bacterium]|nr:hypothetical protein [Candidatus Poribacteria bacterium]|tara:strand:+ start:301 stop:525 length:225 start_codon:yes stop_codon:yes gene_type:complete
MKLNNIVNTYLNQISDEIKKEDNMNILRLRVINPIIKEIIDELYPYFIKILLIVLVLIIILLITIGLNIRVILK